MVYASNAILLNLEADGDQVRFPPKYVPLEAVFIVILWQCPSLVFLNPGRFPGSIWLAQHQPKRQPGAEASPANAVFQWSGHVLMSGRIRSMYVSGGKKPIEECRRTVL